VTSDALQSLLWTARQQAGLARALYGGRDAVMMYAANQKARYRYFEIANNRAAALVFADHAHISICGSNDAKDWLQNATTGRGSIGSLVAHRGYIEAADWIRREFFRSDLITIIEQHDIPIILGGHSAGGAIAQLLSVEPRLVPREVITFGSPKVWERSSAATYYAYPWEVYRFVTDGDIVPYLPFSAGAYLLGRPLYTQATSAIRLSKDGKLSVDELGVFRRAIAGLKQLSHLGSAALTFFVGRRVSDSHSIDRYCEAIDAGLYNVSN